MVDSGEYYISLYYILLVDKNIGQPITLVNWILLILLCVVIATADVLHVLQSRIDTTTNNRGSGLIKLVAGWYLLLIITV